MTNPTFKYDANGNMLCMLGAGQTCDAVHAARFMSWMSFNMVSSIAQGTNSIAIAYGAEHQRYKMCNPNCTAPTATTAYYYEPQTGGSRLGIRTGMR